MPSHVTRENGYRGRRRLCGLSHVGRFITTLISKKRLPNSYTCNKFNKKSQFTLTTFFTASRTFITLSKRLITLSNVSYTGFLLLIMAGHCTMGQSGVFSFKTIKGESNPFIHQIVQVDGVAADFHHRANLQK